MKKILFVAIMALCSVCSFAQQGSTKIIYSNALTHCYVTAVMITDSTVMYNISETSDRKIWRLTDRSETQSAGLLTKEEAIDVFSTALDLFEKKDKDLVKQVNHINLQYVKEWGIGCVKIYTNMGVAFNINKKTAKKAIEALNNSNN